ncbi:MAG: prephenate dehydratase domain-containing protein [Oscillospiraceae bacterium]
MAQEKTLLDQARENIDLIDKQMANLFCKRMIAVGDVAKFKKETGKEIFDQNRENAIILKNIEYLKTLEFNQLPENLEQYYKEFIINLMSISKKFQVNVIGKEKIGFQGTAGAFSQIALKNIFNEDEYIQQAYASFEDVFLAVENGSINKGVIPIENSNTGDVGEVFDLLLKYNLHIIKTYDLPVFQNLLGIKGASISSVKTVYSHSQALAQAKDFISNHNFNQVSFANTALAAKHVSESGDKTKAAIASKETAQIFNLDILAENINTNLANTTRFIVISKKLNSAGEKFSMMFTLNHKSGALADVITQIATLGFNLASIKSRPLKNKPWQYYFYAEAEGNLNDENAKALINLLNEKVLSFKILGVY